MLQLATPSATPIPELRREHRLIVPDSHPRFGAYFETIHAGYYKCSFVITNSNFRKLNEDFIYPLAAPAIPRTWFGELRHFVNVFPRLQGVPLLGFVYYSTYDHADERTAYAAEYDPRKYIPIKTSSEDRIKVASGIPYFFEFMAVSYLKEISATHVSTSHTPNNYRKEQLRKIDLPIKKKVGIDDWLEGLECGILLSASR